MGEEALENYFLWVSGMSVAMINYHVQGFLQKEEFVCPHGLEGEETVTEAAGWYDYWGRKKGKEADRSCAQLQARNQRLYNLPSYPQ